MNRTATGHSSIERLEKRLFFAVTFPQSTGFENDTDI